MLTSRVDPMLLCMATIAYFVHLNGICIAAKPNVQTAAAEPDNDRSSLKMSFPKLDQLFKPRVEAAVVSEKDHPNLKVSFDKLDKLLKPIDERKADVILTVFKEVDRYLMEMSKYSDFINDTEHIDTMLQAELSSLAREKLVFRVRSKKPARNHRVDALVRLSYLAKVTDSDQQVVCSDTVMGNLIEVNKFAQDPVHRLLRFRKKLDGGVVLLRRLDYHIVEAARRRARACDRSFRRRESRGEPDLDLVVEHFDNQDERLDERQHKDRPKLKTSLSKLDKLLKPINESEAEMVSVVFKEVDRYLLEMSKYSDFINDTQHIDTMLQTELFLATRDNFLRLIQFKKPAKNLRLDAIVILSYLAKVTDPNEEVVCSDRVIRNVIEVNKFAQDPVHRLLKFRKKLDGGVILMNRLDYHIVEAVRIQARVCDKTFKGREFRGTPELDLVVEFFDKQVERLIERPNARVASLSIERSADRQNSAVERESPVDVKGKGKGKMIMVR